MALSCPVVHFTTVRRHGSCFSTVALECSKSCKVRRVSSSASDVSFAQESANLRTAAAQNGLQDDTWRDEKANNAHVDFTSRSNEFRVWPRRSTVVVDRWRPGAEGLSLEAGSRSMSSSSVKRWPGSHGNFVDENDVNDVLERLKDAGAGEEGVATAMRGWMKPLSSRTLVAVIKALKGWENTVAFFTWSKSQDFCEVNVYTYNVLLRNLKQELQFEVAEKLMEEMLCRGVKPDNYTYSTMISCASKCKRLDAAAKWYERMYEADCVPDEVTHSTMIDVFAKAGRFEDAIQIYERLKETGWRPDRITCGMVIAIYSKAGRNFEALRVYEEMLLQGVAPSVRLQNNIVTILVKVGKLAQARAAFEKIVQRGSAPYVITLTSLMDAYGRSQEYKQVYELYSRAKSSGWPLDSVAYKTVLKFCTEASLVDKGTRVFTDMSETLQPTAWVYKTMIHLYAKTNRMDEAMSIFSRLVAAGHEPDIVCYTCLIQGFGGVGEYRKLEDIFQQLLEGGCQPDDKFVGSTLAVLSACKTDEQRLVLFRILEKSDPRMHGVVQKLCSGDTTSEEVQGLLETVGSSYSRVAQQRFLNSLTDLCRRLGFRDQGCQLMACAISSGIYPGLHVKFDSLWNLKLATLSVAAAEYALEWWIDSLQAAFSAGLFLPSRFRIELLSSKMENMAKLEGSTLHADKLEVVRSILKGCNAPFEQGVGTGIWFESTLDDIRPWLWSRDAASDFSGKINGTDSA